MTGRKIDVTGLGSPVLFPGQLLAVSWQTTLLGLPFPIKTVIDLPVMLPGDGVRVEFRSKYLVCARPRVRVAPTPDRGHCGRID